VAINFNWAKQEIRVVDLNQWYSRTKIFITTT